MRVSPGTSCLGVCFGSCDQETARHKSFGGKFGFGFYLFLLAAPPPELSERCKDEVKKGEGGGGGGAIQPAMCVWHSRLLLLIHQCIEEYVQV